MTSALRLSAAVVLSSPLKSVVNQCDSRSEAAVVIDDTGGEIAMTFGTPEFFVSGNGGFLGS